MPTTTIELDADLQEKVGALKAPEQSPIAFVRALIEREHSQREQLAAAAAYQALLVAHPEEQAALAEWASARRCARQIGVMKRGTVVWVDLSDAHPPERGKVRPAVIVSGDVHNATLDTVVVVPTSSLAPEILPLRVRVGIFAGKESFAVVPGLRQVSKRRLRGTLGLVDTTQLASLDASLRTYLA